MASEKRNTKSSASSNKRNAHAHEFVICVRNDAYLASLELRKLYQVVADSQACKHRLLRVIDESGEDYLYPADYFVAVKLPQAAERAILKAVQ